MLAGPVEPIGATEQWVGRTSVLLGGVLVIWGVARIVIRPLFDELIFAAWKRKRPETERFMREEIFLRDIEERAANKAMLDRALTVARTNADSIERLADDVKRIGSEQQAMHTLLGGIPLLASGVESINDTLERLERTLERNTDTQVDHGEKIASLSALMGEETHGRRHYTRRATDPRLTDPDPIDEGEPQ
jgi:hypothetical protein